MSTFVFISKADELKLNGKNPQLREQKQQEKQQKVEAREQKELDRQNRGTNPEGRLKLRTCENISGSMSKKISAMDTSISKRKQVMANIEASIQTKINNLKTAGKDTSTIEANFAAFKEKSDAYILEKEAVLTKLKEISALNCETDKETLVQSIRNFNSAFKNHNQKSQEVKKLLVDTVLNPLKALQGKTTGGTN